MDKPNIKWGRIWEDGRSLRILIEPDLVRIQAGHPELGEDGEPIFHLDAEIELGTEVAMELATALGEASFEADLICEGMDHLVDDLDTSEG